MKKGPTLEWCEGYPTEESLDAVRRWLDDLLAKVKEDGQRAFEEGKYLFFRSLCENHYPFAYGEERIFIHGEIRRVFAYHTFGWSGNEMVISMLRSTLWWNFFWLRSDRGGHYYFELPEDVCCKLRREGLLPQNEKTSRFNSETRRLLP